MLACTCSSQDQLIGAKLYSEAGGRNCYSTGGFPELRCQRLCFCSSGRAFVPFSYPSQSPESFGICHKSTELGGHTLQNEAVLTVCVGEAHIRRDVTPGLHLCSVTPSCGHTAAGEPPLHEPWPHLSPKRGSASSGSQQFGTTEKQISVNIFHFSRGFIYQSICNRT